MLKNLTPHPIRLPRPDGSTIDLPTSGQVPRVSLTAQPAGELDGVLVTCTVAGEIEGLPAPEAGTYLVVSRVVADAARDRSDLLVPGDLVRDDQGRVIGARRLESLATEGPRL